MSNEFPPVFVFGIPRSGTTWISQLLGSTGELKYIHEPDNERGSFPALYYKTNLPRFPYITKDQNSSYYRLFQLAVDKHFIPSHSQWQKMLMRLRGFNRHSVEKNLIKYGTGKSKTYNSEKLILNLSYYGSQESRVLIKSVHSILSIPYLYDKINFIPMVILRDPLDIYSSHYMMGLQDRWRKQDPRLLNKYNISKESLSGLEDAHKSGIQMSLFYRELADLKKKIPSLLIVNYHTFILNPYKELQDICRKIKISYTGEMKEFIKSRSKAGTGYKTERVLEEQQSVWRKRISPDQAEKFMKGYNSIDNPIDIHQL